MLIVGQKLRPRMLLLAKRAVHESHRLGLFALGRYLQETHRRSLAKNDDALSIPGDPADINGWAEFFDRSRRDLNSLELAGSWEGKIAAIRGPGNAIRALCSVESPRRGSVQRPQPYSRGVLGFSEEGKCSSVGRQRVSSRKGGKCKTRTFR